MWFGHIFFYCEFAQITGNETVFTNKNGLVIGSFLYDSNHYFVGYIDEFRIWKLFSESETLFKSAENKIENESEKNTFRHKIYNLKSDNNYAKFSEFIILLREKLTWV